MPELTPPPPASRPSCRPACAACCIAPSISSPIPGMPQGKPAGLPCVQLDEADRGRVTEVAGRDLLSRQVPEIISALWLQKREDGDA
jgi:hypothetical protein